MRSQKELFRPTKALLLNIKWVGHFRTDLVISWLRENLIRRENLTHMFKISKKYCAELASHHYTTERCSLFLVFLTFKTQIWWKVRYTQYQVNYNINRVGDMSANHCSMDWTYYFMYRIPSAHCRSWLPTASLIVPLTHYHLALPLLLRLFTQTR